MGEVVFSGQTEEFIWLLTLFRVTRLPQRFCAQTRAAISSVTVGEVLPVSSFTLPSHGESPSRNQSLVSAKKNGRQITALQKMYCKKILITNEIFQVWEMLLEQHDLKK